MFIMLYVQSYFSIFVCWYAVDTGIHKFDLVLCKFIVILVDSRVPALRLLLIVSAGYLRTIECVYRMENRHGS